MKRSALVGLIASTIAGCSGSTAPNNHIMSIAGAWSVYRAYTGSCSMQAHMNLSEDAAGNLSGTVDMEVNGCSATWQSGTVAITAGSHVDPKSGDIVVNAAAPLAASFFIGGEQFTQSGFTGLTGQITGDGVQWDGLFVQ